MGEDRVIVIGGGISGLCTAYYLAKSGRQVVVVERETIGDSASGGNAGILAAGHLPLQRPGLALKAIRWMFDRNSPLYVPPRLDPRLLAWFFAFHRNCTARRIDHCMRTLTPLGRLAMACWEALVGDEMIACDFRPTGWLNVYRSETGRRDAEHEARLAGDLGFKVEQYDGPQLRAREPAFTESVTGAVHFTDSAAVDPVFFLVGLAELLGSRGVEIRVGEAVADLWIERGRCRGVRLATGEFLSGSTTVLAAGIWSTSLAQTAGVKLPMQGGKGYHVDLAAPSPSLKTAAVLAETFVAVNPLGSRLRLAGTVEFSGLNRNLIEARVAMLPRGAAGYLKGISAASILDRGCDLRPCLADGLPVVGWAPGPSGLFLVTGGAKMGMTLGPACGLLAAEQIQGQDPSLEIHSLRANRF